MWEELREAERPAGAARAAAVGGLLHRPAGGPRRDPTCRLVVAEADGGSRGWPACAARPLGPFVDRRSCRSTTCTSDPVSGGRGVGRALVAAAAAFADEVGLEHLQRLGLAAAARGQPVLRPAGVHPAGGAPGGHHGHGPAPGSGWEATRQPAVGAGPAPLGAGTARAAGSASSARARRRAAGR